MTTTSDYENVNVTELVALAREAGFLSAHRGMGRELLTAVLIGEIDPTDVDNPDPIDDERELMLYLQESHPDMILGQLKCKSEHYFCPLCPPARVAMCAVLGFEPGFRERNKSDMLRGIRRP